MAKLVVGGLTTFDLFYYVAQLPPRGGKATAGATHADIGGPAANAAITAADLGSSVALHSVLGSSPFAQLPRTRLESSGVGVVDHADGSALPVASVWVDGAGERTVMSSDNRRETVTPMPNSLDLSDAAAVLLDGHYPHLQLALAERAQAEGVPVVLDCGRWRKVYTELLPMASDVIMASGFRPPGYEGTEAEAAVGSIRADYDLELCAISRGPDPVLVATAGGSTEIPVPEVEVLDTTGAGDVLHGAYLHYRYAAAFDVMTALSAAVEKASHSCSVLGAR